MALFKSVGSLLASVTGIATAPSTPSPTPDMARRLVSLPMRELLIQWGETMAEIDGGRPRARPPASARVLDEAEGVLGVALPVQLREFLSCTNGVDMKAVSHQRSLYSAAELRFGASASPPLSVQAEQVWQEWGAEEGAPAAIRLIGSRLVRMQGGVWDDEKRPRSRTIPFANLDDMLMLDEGIASYGTLMVVREQPEFKVGTVLVLERLAATVYPDLRAWLASSAALVSGLTTMVGPV